MKLSPSAVGKTIGSQLRLHQNTILESQNVALAPRIDGAVAAIMRMKISNRTNAVMWSVVLTRANLGVSVLHGRSHFQFQDSTDKDRRFESAIKQVWPSIASAVRSAAGPCTRVELDITSRRACAVVDSILDPATTASSAPQILLLTHPNNPTATRTNDANIFRMNEAARLKFELENIKAQAKQLTIATDASLGGGQASAAYVATNGSYAGWMVKRIRGGHKRDSLTAELWAIQGALYRFRNYKGPIVLKSDSLNAVSILNSDLSFHTNNTSGYLLEVVQSIAGVMGSMQCESLRIEWVRGHAGDPLNEIADAVAVLTRRHAQAFISAEESDARVRRCVMESLAELKLAA